MKIKYIIYNPAGNITAIVLGDNYSKEEKKIINEEIMRIETLVEQVGFISLEENRLTMAGGEFCGNATRCAVDYYIKELDEMKIEINNMKLSGGKDNRGKVWCEIPIEEYKIIELDNSIYKIVLKGITIIVIKKNEEENKKNLKEKAIKIIKKYKEDDDAVGVMFCQECLKHMKIYPVVWVKNIDTLFFENACGSGTVAVTMLKTFLMKKSNKYKVEQPSGDILETEIEEKDGKIIKAILKGEIKTDNIIKEIIIGGIK